MDVTLHRHIMNLLSKFQSIWLRLCYMIANGNLYANAHCTVPLLLLMQRCLAWCSRKKTTTFGVCFLCSFHIRCTFCYVVLCVCLCDDMQWDDFVLFHPLVQMIIITQSQFCWSPDITNDFSFSALEQHFISLSIASNGQSTIFL